jgi:hypothetical protein
MKMLLRLALLFIFGIGSSVYLQSRVLPKGDSNVPGWQDQIIDDPEANSFVREGLSYAIELYGEPRIAVHKVILRYKAQGSPFTNLTDARKGLFTIYLTHKPTEYAFYGQLAHEIGHLLNAQLYDMYVEGLNTAFSEKLLKRTDKDWSGWEKYYRENEEPFYSSTYFMMKEVSDVAGDEALQSLLSHARFDPKDSQKMYIDIQEWLNSLPRDKRAEVRKVILKHSANVQKAKGSAQYSFILPR